MKQKRKILITTCIFCIQSISLLSWNNPTQICIDSFLTKISGQKNDSVKVNNYLSLLNFNLNGTEITDSFIVQKALETSTTIGWQEGMGLCSYYMGWIYLMDNKEGLAISNFHDAISLSTDSAAFVYSCGILSNIYSWRQQTDSAFHYARKGIDYIADSEFNLLKAEALTFLGDAYRYNGNNDEADKYYKYAIQILTRNEEYRYTYQYMILYVYLNSNAINSPFVILDFIRSIKLYYENADFIQKHLYALSLTKLSMAFSIRAEQEKHTQFQLALKEKETLWYIIGIIILSLLIALLIWENYSRRRSNKELMKANEFKSRLMGILNHDLRRPIAGLVNVLSLKSNDPSIIDKHEVASCEKRNIKMAQNLLENMDNLLFWCKNQMQSFKPEFYNVNIGYLLDDLQSFFSYETDMKLIFNFPADMKIYTDEDYLKIIMRNLTANAINAQKNLPEKVIEWDASGNSSCNLLTIKNRGEIIKKEQIDMLLSDEITEKSIKDGLGLIIIHDLAKSIDCNIKIISNQKDGTIISLLFKKQPDA